MAQNLLRSVHDKSSKILTHEPVPKNPIYLELFDKQVAQYWTRFDVTISQDVQDYKVIDEEGKRIITEVFKVFVTSDRNVATSYSVLIANHIEDDQVTLMLGANNYTENIHETSYALLIDTLGFKSEFHEEFLDNPVYVEKFNMLLDARPKKMWMDYASDKDHALDVLKYIFVTSALTEGISLMSQFSILLFFGRMGKFGGMTTINVYSIADEEIHITGMANLFRDIANEYLTEEEKSFLYRDLKELSEIFRQSEYDASEQVLINGDYEIEEDIMITLDNHIQYIDFLLEYRLHQFLEEPYPEIYLNPYSEWLEPLIGSSVYVDFFSSDVTGYIVGANDLNDNWDTLREKLEEKKLMKEA